MFTVHRTTLSIQNRGLCNSRNNAKFTGSTVCWRLDWNGEDFGAVSRKKDAELVARLFNEFNPEWNMRGDHIMWATSLVRDNLKDTLTPAEFHAMMDQLSEIRSV